MNTCTYSHRNGTTLELVVTLGHQGLEYMSAVTSQLPRLVTVLTFLSPLFSCFGDMILLLV